MAGAKEPMIMMTWKYAVGLILSWAVLMVGTLWILWSFTMDNVQADIADIRDALIKNQSDITSVERNGFREDGNLKSELVDLKSELADLTAQLKITNAGLARLDTSFASLEARVGNLDNSFQAVNQRLVESVIRQTAFERWVTLRLGPAGSDPTSYQFPAEWEKTQGEIFDTIKGGNDPLLLWFKSSDFKQ